MKDTEIEEIHNSAKNVLKILLEEAGKRNFNPPVPLEVVSELEHIISLTAPKIPWVHEISPFR